MKGQTIWMKEPFIRIDKNDMTQVISKGSVLLLRLYDEFSDNPKMQEIVKIKQQEIEKFQNILEHVKILKDPAFKDRHWDELFEHIKEGDSNRAMILQEGRPDLAKLTLSDLIEFNLLSHTTKLRLILMVGQTMTVESECGVEDRSKDQGNQRRHQADFDKADSV